MLADKRRTLLKLLKDKRTVGQMEEASLIHAMKENSVMSSMDVDDLSPIQPRYMESLGAGWHQDSGRPSNTIIFEEGSEGNYSSRRTNPYQPPKSGASNKLKTISRS